MSQRGPGGAARRLAEAAVARLRERASELPTQTRLEAINRIRTRTIEQPADVLAQLEAAGVADDLAEDVAADAAADVGLVGEQAGDDDAGAAGAPTSDLGALRERRRQAETGGESGNPGDDNDNGNGDGGREVQTGLGTQPGTIEFSTAEAADFVRELRDEAGSHAIGTFVEGGDADLLPEQQVKLREAIDVLGEQRVADLADASIDRDDDADAGAFGGQQTLGQAATRKLGEFGDDPDEPPNPTERLVSATPGGTTEFFPAFEKSTARYTLDPGADVSPDARCENCAHYIEGGGCHVVRGPISAAAVCRRFYADAGVFVDDEFDGDEPDAPRISLLLERGGLEDWSPAERRALARQLRRRVADEQGPRAGSGLPPNFESLE